MFALVGGVNVIGLDIICRLHPDEKERARELTNLTSFIGISLAAGKRETLKATGDRSSELNAVMAYVAATLAIGKSCRLQTDQETEIRLEIE